MTPKQKAARVRFLAAVKRAKQIRKDNPKLSHAQAVKKAWQHIKAHKVGAIKIIEKGEKPNAKVKAVFQQQRKKSGKKGGLFSGMKKIAGIGSMQADQLRRASEHLSKWEIILIGLESNLYNAKKLPKSVQATYKKSVKADISRVKKTISELRTHIRELKKHI